MDIVAAPNCFEAQQTIRVSGTTQVAILPFVFHSHHLTYGKKMFFSHFKDSE